VASRAVHRGDILTYFNKEGIKFIDLFWRLLATCRAKGENQIGSFYDVQYKHISCTLISQRSFSRHFIPSTQSKDSSAPNATSSHWFVLRQ
jgi:hypothetical protein